MIDVSKYEAALIAARRSDEEARAAVQAAERALDAARDRANRAAGAVEDAEDRLRAAEEAQLAQSAVKGLTPAMREMLTSDTLAGRHSTEKALHRRGLLDYNYDGVHPSMLGYDVINLLLGRRLLGVPDDMQPNAVTDN